MSLPEQHPNEWVMKTRGRYKTTAKWMSSVPTGPSEGSCYWSRNCFISNTEKPKLSNWTSKLSTRLATRHVKINNAKQFYTPAWFQSIQYFTRLPRPRLKTKIIIFVVYISVVCCSWNENREINENQDVHAITMYHLSFIIYYLFSRLRPCRRPLRHPMLDCRSSKIHVWGDTTFWGMCETDMFGHGLQMC